MFKNIFQLDEKLKYQVIKKFARDDKDAHEYSALMINLDKDIAKKIKEICKENIAEEILFEDKGGRENDSHITVKWGIKTDDVDKFRDFIKEIEPFDIKFGKISLFESEENDVVKIEIISRELHNINKKVKENFDTEETHKEYKPHATLCYILPKRCPKVLIGECALTGKTMMVNEIVFSDRKGKKTTLKLKKNNDHIN